jgi:hypothetical protein
MQPHGLRPLIRSFIIELVVYGFLVAVYSYVVLRWLSEPLRAMFHTNLLLYALLSLGLIVAQGAVLDVITSFLLRLIPTHRWE